MGKKSNKMTDDLAVLIVSMVDSAPNFSDKEKKSACFKAYKIIHKR